jgi:sugar/nucleoside kinase (ribokinase family)
MRRTPKAVVGYGEVLLRLRSPGFERLLQTPRLDVCVGGAEMNVLASLARFGHETRFVTTLPDHALGEVALAEIRAHGLATECGQVKSSTIAPAARSHSMTARAAGQSCWLTPECCI